MERLMHGSGRDGSAVEEFRSTILARHIEAEQAFVSGDPRPRMELWSKRDPVTLFGAIGMSESGWEQLSQTFGWVVRRFSAVSNFRIRCRAGGGKRGPRIRALVRALYRLDRRPSREARNGPRHAHLPTRGR